MALRGYVNADFAGDRSERKSHIGCVYFFCGGVIVSILKRQLTVAVATTKAKYVAMFKAAQEGAWLRQVFKELRYKKKDAITTEIISNN